MLPDVIRNEASLTPRQVKAAVRDQRRSELAVYQHGLAARVASECDQIDSQAAGDAARVALDEELDLLDYGLRRANGSAAKAQLVAMKTERLANANNRRFNRRFGG